MIASSGPWFCGVSPEEFVQDNIASSCDTIEEIVADCPTARSLDEAIDEQDRRRGREPETRHVSKSPPSATRPPLRREESKEHYARSC